MEKQACEQDDVRIYKADKSYMINEGTIRCNPDRPSMLDEGYLGNRRQKAHHGMVSYNSSAEPAEFIITELTDKKLVYTYTSFDVTFTETYTFSDR